MPSREATAEMLRSSEHSEAPDGMSTAPGTWLHRGPWEDEAFERLKAEIAGALARQ